MADAAPKDSELLAEVFFPLAHPRIQAYRAKQGRFVYYTDADTATKIIRNREIWMRGTATMNDFDEVRHGLRMLFSCLQETEAGAKLRAALDAYAAGFADEALGHFKAYAPAFPRDTFITCLSEHDDDEDQHGRLSMWRAYGGRNGVALVFKGERIINEGTYALGALSSPVEYLDADSFAGALGDVADRIRQHIDRIRALQTQEQLRNLVFRMLHAAVLSVKHPGFKEEREWRVYASPRLFPQHQLEPDIFTVRGTPQEIFKIKLEERPERGITGLSLPNLLDRIIIGPCDYPDVTYRAFSSILQTAGFAEPNKILHISGIPLRHF
ncbi:DUF2971 domain-containing protein [Cupriavidus taiwanensis]|uniref:DUF2971 domain-containing protein n=1 Tax=Cupriavidus taiwanensis TaxID=164546 RepID=UPI00253FA241|nr:DUF2971 domain-containing protein [Cupriavidus taiwanensis]MDK3022626.1 DUF2971 domain-containing protein [Cupriavidus taiwanensis]